MTKKSCVMGIKSRTLTPAMVKEYLMEDMRCINIPKFYNVGNGRLINIVDAEKEAYSLAFMFPLRSKLHDSKVEYMLYYPAKDVWARVLKRPNVSSIKHDGDAIISKRGIMYPVMYNGAAVLQINSRYIKVKNL